ncbi:MAG TPA: VOC family protein [Phototrophicaceae bacterium]|jgi:catechol 2,3-dioxygenase-like lactoylglutathione lyase family enzyme|nr:VOC family protein [Phototrophicaceae bacterium]
MIHNVGTVCIFVSDQDRAKAFYTEKLGFELRTDAPLYPGAATRWIAVAPKGAQTEVILYLPDENWDHYRQVVSKSQAVTFNVTDIINFCADLKAKGIEIVNETDPQPWGTNAFIRDSEGNSLLLVQLPGA